MQGAGRVGVSSSSMAKACQLKELEALGRSQQFSVGVGGLEGENDKMREMRPEYARRQVSGGL